MAARLIIMVIIILNGSFHDKETKLPQKTLVSI